MSPWLNLVIWVEGALLALVLSILARMMAWDLYQAWKEWRDME